MIPPLRIRACMALLFCLVCAGSASAHFNLNMNVRIFHVEHRDDGLRVYLRMPMAYLVADRVGPAGVNGLPAPAPFTTNRMEAERLVHLVDWAALGAEPLGLGRIAADGLRLEAAGKELEARVIALRAYPIGREPGFATLAEAKAALGATAPLPVEATETYVGDTIVDLLLEFDAGAAAGEYMVSSQLDPKLPGQEETANVILDHGPGGTEVFRVRGLMHSPVTIARSRVSAAATFVWEGVRHILGGLDHVLFVLCLVLGATGVRSLVSRVTGFTIGHSVTLTAGFFGLVPSGAWFVPTVETGIAVSIIYAAALAVMPELKRAEKAWTLFFVTTAIGLLHGLGFSFVLQEILRIDAPNLWQSLLAFNLGVELGQLAIVCAAWPLLVLLQSASRAAWQVGRLGLASACMVVAAVWTAQRLLAGFGSAP